MSSKVRMLVLATCMLTCACAFALGCRSSTPPSERGENANGPVDATAPASASSDPTSPPPSCRVAIEEKLGVPFVRVCASSSSELSNIVGRPLPLPIVPSFWISTVPMGCSQGAHDTLRCPPIIAVAQPLRVDPPAFRDASSQIAAVVESDTAHSLCAMRFGGRLPTRQERAIARASLGLSTMIAAESTEVGGFRLRELAEWVTERPCDRPTLLATSCGVGGFPWEASASIPWDLIVSCEVTPTNAIGDRALIDVEGACPLSRNEMDATDSMRALPCAVRGSAIDARDRRSAGLLLRCARPVQPPPRHAANVDVDVAAFRCVLPEWH